MKPTAQLPLDLAQRPALDAADFLVAAANAEAVAWIDRWPDWSPPGLVVYGPEACGKSHLARVYLARSGATALTPEDLTAERGAEAGGNVSIDAADAVAGDSARETALFHLLNRVRDGGGTVLLTTRIPPARLPFTLADAASRVRAFPAVGIQPPDDALLGALVVKHFADRQIRVAPDVIDAVITRSERSFAAVRDAVAAIDARALAAKRKITAQLARDVLSER
jgi:chromosomal replication initiation ATPase DnaA